MEYWIIYDLASGDPLVRGSGSSGTAAIQPLPEGAGIVVVPQKVVAQPEIDLDALRLSLTLAVDNEAEVARSRFVTALPAQIGTYVLKEAAARAWLADNDAPVVMLEPEATARGMAVADLVAEVIANADAWTFLSGQIEGLRFGAKARIVSGSTVGAIVEGSAIDWSVLNAPIG